MRTLAVAVVAGILVAGPAAAHPHVWIDAHLGFVMDGSRVTGLRLTWRFDELFSHYVETTYDRNGDRAFDAAEWRSLEAEAFIGVREFGFLTHLRVAGELRPFTTYRDFSATIEEDRVTYRFTLPIDVPPDAARQPVAVALYDDTYYIDVALDDADPVSLDASTGCTFATFEDAANPIYFGMVHPIAVTLRCATS